jgi:threonine dehydrogenase-like Zn-dependent dehydrogenase
MKRYTLAHRTGIDGLKLETDAPKPELRSRTDIRINIKAVSLNARDLQIVTGVYPAPHDVPEGVVPVSGECGGQVAIGSYSWCGNEADACRRCRHCRGGGRGRDRVQGRGQGGAGLSAGASLCQWGDGM